MPAPARAFEHINLRFNPFGRLHPVTAVSHPRFDIPEAVLHLAAGPSRALLIIGPRGSGTSTHLELVAEHVPQLRRVRLEPGRKPRVRRSARRLLVDGVHRLPERALERLQRPGRVLLLASEEAASLPHHDVLSHTLSRPGLSWIEAHVHARLEHARRGPGPLPTITPDHLERLAHTHDYDLHAILAALYDHIQELDHAA